MKLKTLIIFCCLLLGTFSWVSAQESVDSTLAPPMNPAVYGIGKNVADSIMISWDLSKDDGGQQGRVSEYVILRASKPDGQYEERGRVPAGTNVFIDVPTDSMVSMDSILIASGISSQ